MPCIMGKPKYKQLFQTRPRRSYPVIVIEADVLNSQKQSWGLSSGSPCTEAGHSLTHEVLLKKTSAQCCLAHLQIAVLATPSSSEICHKLVWQMISLHLFTAGPMSLWNISAITNLLHCEANRALCGISMQNLSLINRQGRAPSASGNVSVHFLHAAHVRGGGRGGRGGLGCESHILTGYISKQEPNVLADRSFLFHFIRRIGPKPRL